MPTADELRKAAGEPPKGTPNPWDRHHWNLTRQMEFGKRFGFEVAREWAAKAGTTIGGPKPKPDEKPVPGPQGARGQRGASGDNVSDGSGLTLGLVYALLG